eukprot:scaffold42728_cov27-Tisochrysis_lutea.AAC.7
MAAKWPCIRMACLDDDSSRAASGVAAAVPSDDSSIKRDGRSWQQLHAGASSVGMAHNTVLVSICLKKVWPKSIASSERDQQLPRSERLRLSPRSQPNARNARLRLSALE